MIEFLVHNLVAVWFIAAATAVVGLACSEWLLVAIPLALIVLAVMFLLRRRRHERTG